MQDANSTMNAINANSKNPERALMLLNLVNSDKKLYNLLVFGRENLDYKKISDTRIEPLPDKKYDAYAWVMGNQFNAYLIPGQPDDVWTQTKKLNDDAKLTVLSGFKPDLTAFQTQTSQIAVVQSEMAKPLETGSVDIDEFLTKYADKLKKANNGQVIEEAQKQLDEWAKTKK